ncbi:MAG: DedA family protein [Deltaproteobacteria bacterium]|nr:MAG: DedA family protein [Deltaproteobacteria bacterium]
MLESLIEFVRSNALWVGVPVLFFSSLIEYVFPPFPGDTVTLLGAWLVVEGLWSFPAVLGVVSLGSVAGAIFDWWVGRLAGNALSKQPAGPSGSRESGRLKGWLERNRRHIDRASRAYRRWGLWLVAINRFLPGIRAFIFVAAGASGLGLVPVVVLAAISATAWNSLLLWAGYRVGSNVEGLTEWLGAYNQVVWGLIAVVAIALVVVYLGKRVRTRTGRDND